MDIKIYVGVPKNKSPTMDGPSMAILPILKKNKLVDKIIYPAPWYPSIAFLKEKGIDFCAQNPSPVLSIRSYDLYKEVKQAGRMFPINCKSKIEAFQLDKIMLNTALGEQNLVKTGCQSKKKISLQMIEQSLDTKSGFKKVEIDTPSTKANINSPKLDIELINETKSQYSIDSHALKSFKTTRTGKKQINISEIEHFTEEDIDSFYQNILTTYQEFTKAININSAPESFRVDKMSNKLAAPLFRENAQFQSEHSSSAEPEIEQPNSSKKTPSIGLTGIHYNKKIPSSVRIENCVERIIGHKEEVIEECLKNGGHNSSLDLSKRWLRRLRVRRWVEKISAKIRNSVFNSFSF